MGGQIYLTLKDGNSQLSCVIFNNTVASLKFDLEEGMKIIAQGKISVYEKRGQYNFRIFDVQPDGVGVLALAFEKLKKKLYEEGIFSEKYKKPIPLYPKNIAVLASPSGAAVHDVIKVIKNRAPWVGIFVVPIIVQGIQARKSITEGIKLINKYGEIDAAILARGGGTLEELWPFNEEEVVRAIFKSKIPVISAIGHEIDITLSDLVADLRASTPSNAGELVVPEKAVVIQNIENIKQGLKEKLKDLIYNKKEELDALCNDLQKSLESKFDSVLVKLNIHKEKLNLLNPKAILKRGYSIVERLKDNNIIKDAGQVVKNDRLKITLYKGNIEADVV
jgi:exodeoxyribonuclease VII large subunit